MQTADKLALLEVSLERAAERLGDITPYVFEQYYQKFPEAVEHFEELSLRHRSILEGQMIEQSLNCLMNWFEMPSQTRIVIVGTVPHHIDTLRIPPRCFSGLMDTICDVITDTIPPDHAAEHLVWQELRGAMETLFHEGCAWCCEA